MSEGSIVRIRGIVKDYAWGNKDYIPALIGGYSGMPQAEYWMGTHKNGEAVLEDGRFLSEYAGHDLTFLLKILAIDNPLSIQCHPNKRQAIEGWMRESKLRSEGKDVNYQDPHQKAEALIALTPVSALCGFRSIDSIRENLKAFVPESWKLLKQSSVTHWNLCSALYSLSHESRQAVLEELALSVAGTESASMFTIEGIIRKCLSLYPDDIGCLFPLIMNLVCLEPGEGIFLEPGVMHAYCFGNGVEVMTSSDNVLRGGLTHMRMDVPELGRIATFDQYRAMKCNIKKDEYGRTEYVFPCDDFRLVSIGPGKYDIKDNEESVGIIVDGHITIECSSGVKEFSKGESLYVPGGRQYSILSDGAAFFARG